MWSRSLIFDRLKPKTLKFFDQTSKADMNKSETDHRPNVLQKKLSKVDKQNVKFEKLQKQIKQD